MTPEQRQKIAQAGINRLRFQISQEVGNSTMDLINELIGLEIDLEQECNQ